MADAQEDFSFPATISDSPPPFIESPPLWGRPIALAEAGGNSGSIKDEEGADGYRFINLCSFQEFKVSNVDQRKSFCFVVEDDDDGDDEEERMDMLWEGLNEEFSRTSGKMVQNCDNSSPGKEVKISCVRSLKLSKVNGLIVCGKKASILVFIRVLKKAFAMHHSRSSIKKCVW